MSTPNNSQLNCSIELAASAEKPSVESTISNEYDLKCTCFNTFDRCLGPAVHNQYVPDSEDEKENEKVDGKDSEKEVVDDSNAVGIAGTNINNNVIDPFNADIDDHGFPDVGITFTPINNSSNPVNNRPNLLNGSVFNARNDSPLDVTISSSGPPTLPVNNRPNLLNESDFNPRNDSSLDVTISSSGPPTLPRSQSLERPGLLTPRNAGGSNLPRPRSVSFNVASMPSFNIRNFSDVINPGQDSTAETDALPDTPFVESFSADELNTPPFRGALGDGTFPVVPSTLSTGALVRAGVRNVTNSGRAFVTVKRRRSDPNQIAKILVSGKVEDFSGGNFKKLTIKHVDGNSEAADAFDAFLKETYATKNNISFYRSQSLKKSLRIDDLQKIIAKSAKADVIQEAAGAVRAMKREIYDLADKLEDLAKQLDY